MDLKRNVLCSGGKINDRRKRKKDKTEKAAEEKTSKAIKGSAKKVFHMKNYMFMSCRLNEFVPDRSSKK